MMSAVPCCLCIHVYTLCVYNVCRPLLFMYTRICSKSCIHVVREHTSKRTHSIVRGHIYTRICSKSCIHVYTYIHHVYIMMYAFPCCLCIHVHTLCSYNVCRPLLFMYTRIYFMCIQCLPSLPVYVYTHMFYIPGLGCHAAWQAWPNIFY